MFFVHCKGIIVVLHGDCRQGGDLQIVNPLTRKCAKYKSHCGHSSRRADVK
ncbi:hypothetical protein DPMN_117767 [Dreissena polymorpha]|uniref:Uncharacterized protein n=1 Tax=Dreissena polymorpha TaxID=45954 RepID=A0A9D4GIX5_DREPO|nr:hypothetical protein DPMN_117767 [Dreissena polymorpha]